MRRATRHGVHLDSRTQLLYDEHDLFINGEALRWPANGRDALRRIADRRELAPGEIDGGAEPWLYRWYRDGFLHIS